MIAGLINRIGRTTHVNPAKPQMETDWALWLRNYFPGAIRSDFAPHHADFWQWLWQLEQGKKHPKADSFFCIWPRRGGKTTNGQLGVIAVGALKKRRYGWLISRTQSQANNKLLEIRTAISKKAGSRFPMDYPGIARAKADEDGHSLGWRATRLYTDDDFIMDAIGLDTAVRGAKVDFQRPDFIILDDIDDAKDSGLTVEKNIQTLTRDILPAGAHDVAILGLQNLIHHNGIFARIADGRADFLMNRQISGGGPIPALQGMELEKVNDLYVVSAGTPTWPSGLSVEACEDEINRIGPTAFRIELQHEVNIRHEGSVFTTYNELYSVITISEFARFYGKIAYDEHGPRIPAHWYLGRSLDKGTTKPHPSGCIWLARPGKGDLLNDTVFCYRELVLPEWPEPVTLDISPGSVGRRIVDLERPHNEAKRMKYSMLSHEAKDWENALLNDMPIDYRLRFTRWRPDRNAGIGVLQNFMEVIERDKPNPFRPTLDGRSRFILVVADGQGGMYEDNYGQKMVERATDRNGMIRLRAEIADYRYPPDANGQEKELPIKFFDDLIDPLKGLADVMFPGQAPMSQEEKIEAAIPAQYRLENLEKLTPQQREADEMGRYYARYSAKKRIEKEHRLDPREAIKRKYSNDNRTRF